MAPDVAQLVENMGDRPEYWMPFAYGYLKRSVQMHIDGDLTLAQLDEGLSLVERALMTARARLQEQRNAMAADGGLISFH